MKIEDVIQFLIFGSETCNKVTLDKEDVKTLLEYITTLQRKEYNNSKAIEYIKEQTKGYQDDFDRVEEESWLYDLKITSNILKGENKELKGGE